MRFMTFFDSHHLAKCDFVIQGHSWPEVRIEGVVRQCHQALSDPLLPYYQVQRFGFSSFWPNIA